MSPRPRPSGYLYYVMSMLATPLGFTWAEMELIQTFTLSESIQQPQQPRENSISTIQTNVLSLIPVAKFVLLPSLKHGMC